MNQGLKAQIDRLELWCSDNTPFYEKFYAAYERGPVNASLGNVYDLENGFYGHLRPYNFGIFKKVIDIVLIVNGVNMPIGYMSIEGMKGNMKERCAHFKFENSILYQYPPADIHQLICIMSTASLFPGVKEINLSKIELACDSQFHFVFDGEKLNSQLVLNNLVKDEYFRAKRGNETKKIGEGKSKTKKKKEKDIDDYWEAQTKSKKNYESIRYGSNLSEVTAKLYNKTKEIKNSGKEYIRESWSEETRKLEREGLDVFRLEIAMKTDAKRLQYKTEDGTVYDNKGVAFLLSQEAINAFYNIAVKTYFDLRVRDNNETKRCTKLYSINASLLTYCKLWNKKKKFKKQNGQIINRLYIRDINSYRSLKIFAKRLALHAAQCRGAGIESLSSMTVYDAVRPNLDNADRMRLDKIARSKVIMPLSTAITDLKYSYLPPQI